MISYAVPLLVANVPLHPVCAMPESRDAIAEEQRFLDLAVARRDHLTDLLRTELGTPADLEAIITASPSRVGTEELMGTTMPGCVP